MLELLVLASLMAVFFLWGFFVARARGRSGLVWGLACGLTAFIGIAILYSLGDHSPAAPPNRSASLTEPADAAESQAAPFIVPAQSRQDQRESEIATGESSEDRHWRFLSEYHPQVRSALAAVAPLGEDALDELRAAHMELNDASLLPAITQRLSERFGAAGPSKLNGSGAAKRQVLAPASVPAPASEDAAAQDDDEPLILDLPVAARGLARATSADANANVGTDLASPRKTSELAKEKAKVALPSSLEPAAQSLARTKTAETAAPQGRTLQREPLTPPPAPDTDAGDILDDASPADAAPMSAREEAAALNGHAPGGLGTPDAGNRADRPLEVKSTSLGRQVPDRTNVQPADLQGAKFLETYSGVHLFGLADGRVFIDRHEARGSLDLARNFVDQMAARRLDG